jgi:NAD(P)-dependent dehydrogenase (short-subunit alcohol dehydrogenase family)
MKLTGAKIAITGGAKGLGHAMADAFAAKGASVAICDRDKIELEKVGGEGKIKVFTADVTVESDVLNFAKDAAAALGGINIWINNAGVWMPPVAIDAIDMENAKRLFSVNVFGTIHGMRAALSQMKPQKQGTIVNIISTTAFDGMTGSSGSMYVASKYALRGLTNAVRDELVREGIKVIGVYPGGMKTDLFNEAKPENLGEFMSPTEIAQKIVANLESDEPEIQLVLKRPGQKQSNELGTN